MIDRNEREKVIAGPVLRGTSSHPGRGVKQTTRKKKQKSLLPLGGDSYPPWPTIFGELRMAYRWAYI